MSRENVELKKQLLNLKDIQKKHANGFCSATIVEGWFIQTKLILEQMGVKRKVIKMMGDKIGEKEKTIVGYDSEYNIQEVIEIAEPFLQSIIEKHESDGSENDFKNTVKNSPVNFTVIQQNSQTVMFDLVVKNLRNELSESQFNEIRQILENKDEQIKKTNLTQKLKEFGIDALSGIISGILTNTIS